MGHARRLDTVLEQASAVFPGSAAGPGGAAVSPVDLADWAAHRYAEAVRMVSDAERRQRRAVWGLLCGEQPLAAATMAEALDWPLPPIARVMAVACDQERRDAVADLLRRTAPEGAWIVRDTGEGSPLAVLLPAGERDSDDDVAQRVARELVRAYPQCRVGASSPVDLASVPGAFGQARYALTAARVSVSGYARFHAWLAPELLMAGQADAWAREQLAPLATHRARRRGDPEARELLETLGGWLADRRGAGSRLGIHRNTLSGRLRLIEALLDRDLHRIGDRAQLSLALRITALPRGGRPEADAGPVSAGAHLPLDHPALDGWAFAGLRPLAGGLSGPDAHTLRVWLANDTRLSATAAELGLTVPGARKRLTRIGNVLGLDLLHGPHAEADLWLALQVADRPREPHTLTDRRRAS
ncbi:helix-turn-helix domain-containing protein [Yinghuangia sp. YIM S09857]|uniref:helix-turn-helix domain-containing protein n=1 Tax=Yinghuangia sp. YIM S09857 TaxID=3436929 RepID=UPI003F530E71